MVICVSWTCGPYWLSPLLTVLWAVLSVTESLVRGYGEHSSVDLKGVLDTDLAPGNFFLIGYLSIFYPSKGLALSVELFCSDDDILYVL